MKEIIENYVRKFFTFGNDLSDVSCNWEYVYSLPEFAVLKTCRQNPKWHSEGEFVSSHVEGVVEEAVKYVRELHEDIYSSYVLLMTALFHDIGKGTTTEFRKGAWHHYGHEFESERITRRMLWDLGFGFREYVCRLVRYHMEPLRIITDKEYMRKFIDLDRKCGDIRLLLTLKEFDSKGSVAEDPEQDMKDLEYLERMKEDAQFTSPMTDHRLLDNRDIRRSVSGKKRVTVYVMIGLPGSGKDTFISNNLEGLKTVCRDDIRAELGYCGKDDKFVGSEEQEKKVSEVFDQRAVYYAKTEDAFVINNISLKRKYRDAYKTLLKDFAVEWHYVMTEADGLDRNIERRPTIGKDIFEAMIMKFDYPTYDEYDAFERYRT